MTQAYRYYATTISGGPLRKALVLGTAWLTALAATPMSLPASADPAQPPASSADTQGDDGSGPYTAWDATQDFADLAEEGVQRVDQRTGDSVRGLGAVYGLLVGLAIGGGVGALGGPLGYAIGAPLGMGIGAGGGAVAANNQYQRAKDNAQRISDDMADVLGLTDEETVHFRAALQRVLEKQPAKKFGLTEEGMNRYRDNVRRMLNGEPVDNLDLGLSDEEKSVLHDSLQNFFEGKTFEGKASDTH